MTTSIQERVFHVVGEYLEDTPAHLLTRETKMEDIGADSLDAVYICMAVEDEFAIEISDDEESQIKTLGDLVDLVVGKNPEPV
jgi:acyl carrier protein